MHPVSAIHFAQPLKGFRHWCMQVDLAPCASDSPLVSSLLYLLLWGEAANIRQMPEMLCFIFHAFLLRAGTVQREPYCKSYLGEVIRPLYDVVALRQTRDGHTCAAACQDGAPQC